MIDDYKLQMYVDDELDLDEKIKVEEFINKNNEARLKVENYIKINNLIFENYKSIETENFPKKTIDLLLKEDISFLRPCPKDALSLSINPVGKKIKRDIKINEYLKKNDL